MSMIDHALHLHLLIVDDNEDDAFLIARQFRSAGYRPVLERVDTAPAMSAALAARDWDIIIADVTMPAFSAAGAIEIYGEHGLDCPFIVVSGTIDEETAVSLLRSGAHDFLLKTNLARLVPAAERELRETKGRQARRHAEEALRASEERYALAAKGANDGLWDWNLRTNCIYFSPRWMEMLGLGVGEITDKPNRWLKHIHPDDYSTVLGSLNDHLEGHSPHFSAEYRIRHGDGQWRWMLSRGLAVSDENGIPCRIAGSQTDISGHKQAEQSLRQAKDELEQAVAAKTRFLAAASHDLRQPVQALLCFASLLGMQVGDERAQGTLADLSKSLESLKGLLDALLDVSKLDAGMVKPDVLDLPVASLLEQIAAEMRPQAEKKGLQLRLVPSTAWVRSDPVLLGRILRNFVENAIRYTDRGAVLIGCRRRGSSVGIEVVDTGVGINTDDLPHIFEEFFQVGNLERDRMKGLGLGLAVVSRLGRLLNHPIEVHSVPGRGTAFSVGVTVAETHSQAAQSADRSVDQRPSPRQAAPSTILVIDDEKLVATALSSLLQVWGFAPFVAASPEEAKAILDGPPTAIIADYRLRNGLTGVEAVKELRSFYAAPIPCILVTGDTAASRLREIAESGSLLLHKPVLPKDLQEALNTLLAENASA